MKNKAYKKSKAAYDTINKIFNELNDFTDSGYTAIRKIEKYDSFPWEIKDLITRCWKVLDYINDALTEDDFIWLSDLEDFLEDEMPESIAEKMQA